MIPEVEPSDNRPLVVVSVICIALLPASTSLTVIALPLPVLNTRLPSCCTLWPDGTLLTSASLTALTASISAVDVACAPPVPLLPPSLMPTLSVTLVVLLLAVRNDTFPAAIKALILAIEPVSVSDVPLTALTVTPEPLRALSVPLFTANEATTDALPASTSEKLMPVRVVGRSSVTPIVPGAVMAGASFTATTLTVEAIASAVLSTPPLLVPPLSRMPLSVTTRFAAVGFSLLLR